VAAAGAAAAGAAAVAAAAVAAANVPLSEAVATTLGFYEEAMKSLLVADVNALAADDVSG